MPDIAVKPVLWAGAAIAATVGAVVLGVFGLLHLSGVEPGGERLRSTPPPAREAPGLDAAPQPQLARERRAKEARLHSFGWVDRAHGIAHIPIEDAMDILASRRPQGGSP